MIGDVASPVDFVDFDAAAGEELLASENVLATGVAAEGEDRRMFKEQKSIGDALLVQEFDEPALEIKAVGVADSSEVEEIENHSK
jgi:hypothetical protein